MGWAFVAVKLKTLAGRLERKSTVGKRQMHQESPISAKGPFKVHRALTAENKELICS